MNEKMNLGVPPSESELETVLIPQTFSGKKEAMRVEKPVNVLQSMQMVMHTRLYGMSSSVHRPRWFEII